MPPPQNPPTQEDPGTKFASHWTPSENLNIPLPIPELEAARAERRKNYLTIAKEFISPPLPSPPLPYPPLFPPPSPIPTTPPHTPS